MLRVVGSFCFIGIFSLVSAFDSCPQQNVMNCHDRRQVLTTTPVVPLPAASTSSFDWWPYHSTTTSVPPTLTEVEPGDDDSLETSKPSTSDGSSLESSTIPSSTRIDASESALSTILSESDSTTTSALITITALPPLASPFKHGHRISAYRQPTSLILFAPLFGILGLGSGLAFGWYICGYWKRRNNARTEERLAGPRYEGVKSIDDDDDQKSLEKRDHDGAEDIDGVFLLEEPFLCNEGSNMPGARDLLGKSVRRASMLHRSPLLSGLLGGRRYLRSNQTMHGDDKVRGRETRCFPDTIFSPNAPTVFSSVASSDDDDYYEDARQVMKTREMVYQKSIRRRLAEKLRMQFNAGRSMTRKKSRKEKKARGTTPELEEGVLMQDNSFVADSPMNPEKTPLRRTKTRPANSVGAHGRAISDFSVELEGVQAPPRVYTLKDLGVSSPMKDIAQTDWRDNRSPSRFANVHGIADSYTPLPERKTRKLVSARSTRRRTEILEDSKGPPKFDLLGNADRRVLPTSPPLLNSPGLESALFFSSSGSPVGPTREAPRFAQFDRDEYHAAPAHDIETKTREPPSRRASPGTRKSRRLVSKHSPANGMDAFTAGATMTPAPLRRSTARASSCSPTKRGYGSGCTKHGRERSSTLYPVPMSPRERYEARQTAFNKVDAIIERSWSARLLQSPGAATVQPRFGS